MSKVKRCAACGHTAADHAEGDIGAAYWQHGERTDLCHQADHSCYAPTVERASSSTVTPFAAVTDTGGEA